MALIQLHGASLDMGHGKLLDAADFAIDAGERIALVGRNGAGKSTLMRALLGEVALDAGRVDRQQGVRLAWLPQEVPTGLTGTVFEEVAHGAGPTGVACAAERRLAADPNHDPSALALAHAQLEAAGAWDLAARIERLIDRAGLEPDVPVPHLSGGQKRRVLLARALLAGADVLLLDEPTNHLDIPAIESLEALLRDEGATALFVSHDRAFIDAVATRIVELDRGRLTSYPRGWERFIEAREARIEEEERHQALFDKRLAQEETWIRRGVQARRTRDMGRVARLEQMRRERAERRNRAGVARMEVVEADRSGRLVIEAEGLRIARGDRTLVQHLDLLVMRGDCLAIVGPNGAGKTTLLETLLGDLAPAAGRARLGTNLQMARFDQMRETLDPDATVMDTVGDGADRIRVGERTRHVAGYLRDFLFDSDRLRSKVHTLSGGERNRLLLARHFTRPANLLILDEPTNDLDLETLDLLETLLADFGGTTIVVSHDRTFVDRVATATLVLDGQGNAVEYAGGWSDSVRQRAGAGSSAAGRVPGQNPPKAPAKGTETSVQAHRAPESAPRGKDAAKKPLAPWEVRELDELPSKIEAEEASLAAWEVELQDPSIWSDGGSRAAELGARVQARRDALEALYTRWAALEERAGGG